jgi:colanic acid/amylovoran biosynthesis glycosyltransferase
MKIAFILDSFPSLSETFILNQITGLIDKGHEIDIYAKTGDFANIHEDVYNYGLLKKCCYLPPSPPNRWVKYLKSIKPIFTLLVNKPRTFPLLLNTINSGTPDQLFRLLNKGSPLIKEKDYDIIQCHYGTNGILGVILKKFGVKGKLVTMFHGYDIRIAQESNGKIYEELFRFGDCFLSISDYSHNNLIRFGAPKQKIIYHPVGIDLNKFIFKWLVTNNPFTPPVKILTVARLTEEKGLQHGIQAISKLLKKNHGLDLE